MARKLALIIGSSQYDDPTLARLKAPEADVGALAGLLRAPEIGGFDHVATLVNNTFAEVHPAIAAFFADKRPDDLLLLYFSGHGVLDAQGRLYLGLKNTQRSLLSGSAIASTFVKDEMDSSRSRRQVLILDCCHSGAFARGGKGALGAQAITDATFEGHGRVVLTATDTTQYAWEGDQIIGETEHSLFTHFVIEGLKTGAADTDGDGHITPDELYEFVFGRIVHATSKQKPRKIVYDQQGDLIIARNPHRPRPALAELPAEIRQALESPLAGVRAGAIVELNDLLGGSRRALALAARAALTQLTHDDSLRVRAAAAEALTRHAGLSPQREGAQAGPVGERAPLAASRAVKTGAPERVTPEPVDRLIGKRFGPYLLEEFLGRGGMTMVYRGRQETLQRTVVVKILPAELMSDPNFSARFMTEARTLAKLSHPAILPVYDFGEVDGAPYLVVPFMANGTLAERLKAGPLPIVETIRIVKSLASALDFAHRSGILHRDVSPGNIFFDKNDNPYLADFGLAKAFQASAGHFTAAGIGIVGTPDYMSPEQARGDAFALDHRSDIYTLGIVTYECLAGTVPFRNDTPVAVLLRHIKDAPPSLRLARPEIPEEVERAVLKALAKSPEDRFASAGEFAQALSAAEAGQTRE